MPDHHDRREWAENHWRKIGKDLALSLIHI